MKLITFVSLFYVSISTFGQTKQYSEKEVYSIFKKSIYQNSKKSITTFSNPWVSCNQDSSYFLNDTIQISNSLDYSNNSNCCNYIGWTFYKKNKFILNDFNRCKAQVKVTTNKDFYKIRVFSKNSSLYFEKYTFDNTLSSIFEVIHIEDNLKFNSSIITLKRIKF